MAGGAAMGADGHSHMKAALALAARGLGRTWPNPAVGCLLVKNGAVVGRGWTQPGGRPHAETQALAQAGAKATGATAYVTLEPCSHHGKTPPCAEALVAARIAACVVATGDPDPRVSGRGLAMLRQAGTEITTGLLEAEARRLNAGFFLRLAEGRPLVTLKLATSLDGRIALAKGESRWITGEAARAEAHRLRATHDAVLVGSGTALIDDPELTVRLPGLENRQPLRLILDGRLRLPLTHKLVASAARHPTWLITRQDAPMARRAAYESAAVTVITVPVQADEPLDLKAALRALGQRGLTRLLVEGGGQLAAALLAQNCVDRLVVFRAPSILGGDAVNAVAGLALDRLAGAPQFHRTNGHQLGVDFVENYDRVTD